MASRLTPQQREQLRLKFGGRCAYCGETLPARWHADHFEPIHRMDWIKTGAAPLHPSRDAVDNMMPACPRCNISKGPMALETWREWIARHVDSLNAYHPIYRVAKAFGLIVETHSPIEFYFERAGRAALEKRDTTAERAS